MLLNGPIEHPLNGETMHTIFKTEFGSIVYGTNLPTSDKDYKSIFLPTAKEIILQQVKKVVTSNTKIDATAKNTSEDVDDEAMSLQYFLKLLSDGQTPMIDMLFAPKRHHIISTPIWDEIFRNKDKILSCNVAPVIGYCRLQAAKYGIKGSRVAGLRKAISSLEQASPISSLRDNNIEAKVQELNDEFIKIVMVDEKSKGLQPHLEVCNKKFPLHCKIKYVLDCLEKTMEGYGHRALAAETNQGVDFKALYHSVRVAREGEELLLTGNITFPRPEADLLLKIRKGEMHYKDIAELIEEGLDKIRIAEITSVLRKEPDLDWINDFVYDSYLEVIKDGM